MKNSNAVEDYLSYNIVDNPFYAKCYEARYKYIDTNLEYYYTDEDYNNFLMLASAWSAIVRKAWRLFVLEGDCEPSEFWNGFIKTFTFNQSILMTQDWSNLNKYHKDLVKKIEKTSNPNFLKKMFTGFDWSELHKELKKIN